MWNQTIALRLEYDDLEQHDIRHFIINKRSQTVRKISDEWKTLVADHFFSSGLHYWEIEIINSGKNNLMIGVVGPEYDCASDLSNGYALYVKFKFY